MTGRPSIKRRKIYRSENTSICVFVKVFPAPGSPMRIRKCEIPRQHVYFGLHLFETGTSKVKADSTITLNMAYGEIFFVFQEFDLDHQGSVSFYVISRKGGSHRCL